MATSSSATPITTTTLSRFSAANDRQKATVEVSRSSIRAGPTERLLAASRARSCAVRLRSRSPHVAGDTSRMRVRRDRSDCWLVGAMAGYVADRYRYR